MPLPAYERRTRNYRSEFASPRNPDWRAEPIMNAKHNWSYQEERNPDYIASVPVPAYRCGFTSIPQIRLLMRKGAIACVDGTTAVLEHFDGRVSACLYSAIMSMYYDGLLTLLECNQGKMRFALK